MTALFKRLGLWKRNGFKPHDDEKIHDRFLSDFWATEYKIDGFRFDRMALHDIETVNIIRDELNKIDPQILMYGEGWTGRRVTAPC